MRTSERLGSDIDMSNIWTAAVRTLINTKLIYIARKRAFKPLYPGQTLRLKEPANILYSWVDDNKFVAWISCTYFS